MPSLEENRGISTNDRAVTFTLPRDPSTPHPQVLYGHGRDLPRLVACALAASAGICLVVSIYHPGYLSSDCDDQLRQARSGLYHDWHPPLMAWVWHWIDRIHPGPSGMLLLQNGLFWGGVTLVAWLVVPTAAIAPVVLLVGLFPPILGLLGTIWKDVQMGAALTLGFGLLCFGQIRRSRLALVTACLPIFYAAAIRHNGIVVVFPFLLWLMALATQEGTSASRRLAGSVALAAVAWLSIQRIDALLAGPRATHPLQQVFLFDLAALSVGEGVNLLPAPWHDEVPLDRLRQLYQPASSEGLFWPSTQGVNLSFERNPALLRKLRSAWLHSIVEHPSRYLEHRLHYFLEFLAWGSRSTEDPLPLGVEKNDLGIAWHPSRINRWATRGLVAVQDSWLFRPWLYLLLDALAFAVLSIWFRDRQAALALSASGLCNLLPYFTFGPAPDFRFAWWTVISVALLPLAVLVRPKPTTANGGAPPNWSSPTCQPPRGTTSPRSCRSWRPSTPRSPSSRSWM